MPPFDFAGSPVAVREDIGGAHARAWERIAAPGSWWTGAERVAIAQEVRSAEGCALCRERRVALSPAAVQGEHEPSSVLPETAVEAVHRLVTDTSRLSQAWYQGLLADGLSDAHYVEIVGVVTSTFSVDELHRGVGAPLEPLPEPRPGEPEQRRPSGATMEGAWVPTVPPGGLDAADADLYAAYDGGHVGNVIRAMSLAPGEVRGLRDLSNAHYLPPGGMRSLPEPRALSRRQIELIASRVSVLNECFYWTNAHVITLRASVARSGGELDIRGIADREIESGIADGELLLDFADALVGRDESLPGQRDRLVERLGGAALVDASGVVANFQRMVRIADGTGIPLDEGMREESRELSGVLGIGRFASASNTPSQAWLRPEQRKRPVQRRQPSDGGVAP